MHVNTEKPAHDSILISSMIEIAISLLDDARIMFKSYRRVDYNKDIECIKRRAYNEGVTFFTNTITNISNGILRYLEYNSSDFPNFAKKGTFEYPAFLSGIFKLAYDANSLEHKQAIGFLYQFGSSFKKLKGPYPVEVLQKQMEEFVSVDIDLGSIDNNNEPDMLILEHARAFITRLFSSINENEDILFDRIIPRPGPGATNKPVALNRRFKFNTIYRQIDSVLPYDEWFYPSYAEWAWDIPYYRECTHAMEDYTVARFEFVDKVVGKARGICIEQNEMQFFQQGLKRFLYDWIENHPLTKGHVNFTHQSVNQSLALASSLSRTHATIDMSEASDRVPRRLVMELFRDVPSLCKLLDGLSTRYIDISKYSDINLLECNKFAPMGSGLCFPIMSLIHYALIHSILYISLQNDSSLNQIYVYGDDIVIPSTCARPIFDWLPRFGMKINEMKSYVKSSFRESCGVHAYQGLDITPVYFKYITGMKPSPTVLSSLIANEALLYTKGYYKTASYIRGSFKNLPYVSATSSVCGWKRPQSFCIKFSNLNTYARRWNAKLQRVEYKMETFRSKKSSELSPAPDSEMYFRGLLTQAHSHHSFWARPINVVRRVWLGLSDIFPSD